MLVVHLLGARRVLSLPTIGPAISFVALRERSLFSKEVLRQESSTAQPVSVTFRDSERTQRCRICGGTLASSWSGNGPMKHGVSGKFNGGKRGLAFEGSIGVFLQGHFAMSMPTLDLRCSTRQLG